MKWFQPIKLLIQFNFLGEWLLGVIKQPSSVWLILETSRKFPLTRCGHIKDEIFLINFNSTATLFLYLLRYFYGTINYHLWFLRARYRTPKKGWKRKATQTFFFSGTMPSNNKWTKRSPAVTHNAFTQSQHLSTNLPSVRFCFQQFIIKTVPRIVFGQHKSRTFWCFELQNTRREKYASKGAFHNLSILNIWLSTQHNALETVNHFNIINDEESSANGRSEWNCGFEENIFWDFSQIMSSFGVLMFYLIAKVFTWFPTSRSCLRHIWFDLTSRSDSTRVEINSKVV